MWRDDLVKGEAVEAEFLDRVLVAFQEAYQTFGEDSRFDIEIPELNCKVEVKFDPKSLETGNIVVEYFHNKPSAMLVSEATHWLFVTGEEEIWISFDQLLACILVEGLEPVQIHGPDDRHPKAVFLVPVETLRKYANASQPLV